MSKVVASVLVVDFDHFLSGQLIEPHQLVKPADHPVVVENAFMNTLGTENVPIVINLNLISQLHSEPLHNLVLENSDSNFIIKEEPIFTVSDQNTIALEQILFVM